MYCIAGNFRGRKTFADFAELWLFATVYCLVLSYSVYCRNRKCLLSSVVPLQMLHFTLFCTRLHKFEQLINIATRNWYSHRCLTSGKVPNETPYSSHSQALPLSSFWLVPVCKNGGERPGNTVHVSDIIVISVISVYLFTYCKWSNTRWWEGLALFPGPAQLSIACSTKKRREPGIFSHINGKKISDQTGCVSRIVQPTTHSTLGVYDNRPLLARYMYVR